jgi:hypothetical protein
LANHNPELASWEYAARIVEAYAAKAKDYGSRTFIMQAKRLFLSVAHLWGAYCIRGRKWQERVDVNYSFGDDVESFLAEAEILRRRGQTCIAGAARTPNCKHFSCNSLVRLTGKKSELAGISG